MADQKDLFHKVRTKVVGWVNHHQIILEQNIKKSILVDNEDYYAANFDFKNCMAELVVNQPDFAPYRFVSFMVAAFVDREPRYVYVWYDDDSYEIEGILEKLDEGIHFANEYVD